MNRQVEIQQAFFEHIFNRHGKRKDVVQQVQELLFIKKGAAYKRISGETALTLEEAVHLSQHFRLSLDTVFQSEKYISFFHPFTINPNPTPETFLVQFSKLLNSLKNDKTPSKQLFYLANEIPVFYYLGHKYIFNFLMNVWGHLHWDNHKMEISLNDNYSEQADILRSDMLNNYYGNSVTEIWNSNMMNNLYQQVIFCITIRAFKEAEFVDRLMNDIENLHIHLRTVSVEGIKSIKGAKIEGSELKIYLNDFGNYLNMVIFDSEELKNTFVGYDYPQFIMSANQSFCQFSKEWIQKIMKRSVLISSEGYQYRELFFIKMETDYKFFKTRVEKLMGIYYS